MNNRSPDGKLRVRFSAAIDGAITRSSIFYLLSSLLLLGAGCRTARPLPPVDLSKPGWHVLQGQAVWQPPGHHPEIAGDLMLATNANGNYFIQFTKTPFVIATAEVQDGRWDIRLGKYHRGGTGHPSGRFVWFQLPAVSAAQDLNDGWKSEPHSGNLWRLKNPHTGETLAGEFFP